MVGQMLRRKSIRILSIMITFPSHIFSKYLTGRVYLSTTISMVEHFLLFPIFSIKWRE